MKDENIIIVGRFFEIVETLKKEKIIRGLKTLCDRYGWNRWNVQTMREDPAGHSAMLRPSWLAGIVRDYMVNPLWILTGEGTFFRDGWDAEKVRSLHKKPEKMQIKRKRGRPRKQPVENQLFADGV